jgi:Dihydrodipicolinate synthetase family
VQALCDAFLSDRFADARRIHAELFPIARGLLSLDTNPVPLKCAMEFLGRDTGALRLPMCRLAESSHARVHELLRNAGLTGGRRGDGAHHDSGRDSASARQAAPVTARAASGANGPESRS